MSAVFIAPILEPTNGRWIDVDGHYDANLDAIYEESERVQKRTGHEETAVHDVDGLPTILVPRYGGLNAKQIAAAAELAETHGSNTMRAHIKALNQNGLLNDVDPPKWARSLERSMLGCYDSKKDHAWTMVEHGLYGPDLMQVADSHPSYIDIDAVVRDIEAGAEIDYIRQSGNVYAFNACSLML